MSIRTATEADQETIREIYNDAVINTTATFDLEPRSREDQRAWFAEHVPPHPVIVWEGGGRILGWGSTSAYATRPAYRFTGEVSVYVAAGARRRGIGEALLRELMALGGKNGLHLLVGRITEENAASVRLAEKTGFVPAGLLEEVGFKFDRWLNVALYQKRCDG
jgi:L-amino acid N-acyltransferase YncA